MKVHTNLLSQLLQLVLCLAANNLHLGVRSSGMNQEIKRVERQRRFHTLSTNFFCLAGFLSFVEGLLGLFGLARLNLSVELDVETSCSASSLLRVRAASVRDLLSCSSSTTTSVSIEWERGGIRRKRGHTLESLHILLENTTRFLRGQFGLSFYLAVDLLELRACGAWRPRPLGVALDLIDLVLELLHIDLEGCKTLLKEKRREVEVREGRSNTYWSCGSSLQQTLHPRIGCGAHRLPLGELVHASR